MSTTDCRHTCCDTRTDPDHDHFLSPAECPRCAVIACRWCGRLGFHSEFCEGFNVNDPARAVGQVVTPATPEDPK